MPHRTQSRSLLDDRQPGARRPDSRWRAAWWRAGWLAAALVLASGARASSWPPELEDSLARAGENRPELERVLEHYTRKGEPQQLAAAHFLIANMEEHGYAVYALFDRLGQEVAFDPLAYPGLAQAQAALAALTAERGPLEYERKSFVQDLHTIRADFLIENIELAFAAWRGNPWAARVSFETFLEYVLPYRANNEPLEPWRAASRERLGDLSAGLTDPGDPLEAGRLVRARSQDWVAFDELYYLHPTDQGFEELLASRAGRCEDQSTMTTYALRASGVAATGDYTPFWADRDNNHAWDVLLDGEGRGRARLAHRAAKVYRNVYAVVRDSLGYLKASHEAVPRWLSGIHYRDVTDQYMETSDVTLELTLPRPEGARFAYLCVFNDGDWRPVHWGRIEGSEVRFTKMGRGIAYLPAYYVDGAPRPAAAPFVLSETGELQPLEGTPGSSLEVALAAAPGDATLARSPHAPTTLAVEPRVAYELRVWNDGWQSLATASVAQDPVVVGNVPAGRLYWLVRASSGRRLERIFSIENGRQMLW